MVVPVYFVTFTSATLITSFILYQGLKASAVTLVTMVFGFLVICLGITLLQMSKVDPKQLTKLDRKATIFLEAAHHPTEETEKGNISSMEEPGIDALRGGFGSVGSIIRARTLSRRMSAASSQYGRGFSGNQNLSTHGMGNLQRFQLSDNPMPDDAMDQVSLHAKSPISARSNSFHSFLFPKKSFSSSHFEEADVGHSNHSKELSPVGNNNLHPHFANQARPVGARQGSASSGLGSMGHMAIYPPLVEEPEEAEGGDVGDVRSTMGEKAHSIFDLYLSPRTASRAESRPTSRAGKSPPSTSPTRTPTSPLSPGGSRLANMFHFGQNEARGEVRGGARRGTKDYPHLKSKDFATEREERAALFSPEAEDVEEVDNGSVENVKEETVSGKEDMRPGVFVDTNPDRRRSSYEDEPLTAMTDDSVGNVLRAEFRPSLPPIVTTPPANVTAQPEPAGGPKGPRGPRGKR